jgi:hypothetical protein
VAAASLAGAVDTLLAVAPKPSDWSNLSGTRYNMLELGRNDESAAATDCARRSGNREPVGRFRSLKKLTRLSPLPESIAQKRLELRYRIDLLDRGLKVVRQPTIGDSG